MKAPIHLRLVNAIKAILLFFPMFVTSQMAFSQNGTLNISVKDSKTGVGIKSEVIVQSETKVEKLVTSEFGKLTINGLSGRCDLTVATEGYKTLSTYYTLTGNQTFNAEVLLDPVNPKVIAPDFTQSVISGHIVNKKTGAPLKGVKVSVTGSQNCAVTDEKGFYRIAFNEVSSSDEPSKAKRVAIELKKKKFKKLIYSNLPLLGDELNLNLELVPGKGQEKYEYHHKLLDEDTGINFYNEGYSETSELKKKNSDIALRMGSNCPTPPAQIRVGTGCPTKIVNGQTVPDCNVVCSGSSSMSMENYVQSGLDNEWINSWNTASLKAGSVAYRTYGSFFVLNQPLGNPNYDIRSDACNQAWGSTAYPNSQNAVSATAGEVLVNSSNQIVKAEYSAETNNTGCGNCNSGSSSWPCISDNVCCGYTSAGHGRGMCQWGSKRWGDQSQTYTWILDHYYNPGNYYRCTNTTTGANLTKQTDSHTISGTSVSFDITVINSGTSSAGSSSTLAYYASSNTTISTSDYQIGTDNVSNLSAGATERETATINVCSFVPNGTYYVGYLIDYANDVAESDESDNAWVFASTITCGGGCTAADLIVETKAVTPTVVAAGGEVNASVTTANIGQAASDTDSDVGFYLSSDCTFDGNDEELSNDELSVIQPGNSENDADDLTIPCNTPPGTYYIIFYVDDNTQTDNECDENNNFDCVQITVTSPPSFTLSTYSETVASGTGTISIVVNGPNNCDWNASESCSWVDITSPTGTGGDQLHMSVDQNTGANPRTCLINVSGQTFTLTQEGTAPCNYSLSPASINLTSVGGSGSFTLTTSDGNCSWVLDKSQNCINGFTIDELSGAGTTTLNYTVPENTSAAIQICTVTIRGTGVSLTLTQEGAVGISETNAISSLSIYPNPNSGLFTIQIELSVEEKIELSVLNILGQIVHQETPLKTFGVFTKKIELKNVANGVYLVKVKTGEKDIYRKIIVN